MLSASAFGSADNTYLDLVYSVFAVLAMFLANSSPFCSWRNEWNVLGRKTSKWSVLVPEWTNSIITSFCWFTSLMSRCQNSQSNSQERQKAAQASKIELKSKRSREKGNKKGFAVTQPIQYYSHRPLIAWSGVLLVSVLQSCPNSWMLNV